MTEPEAQAILDRTLAHATADHTQVTLSGFTQGATRFANNAITQNIAKAQVHLQVQAAFGQRVGTASGNSWDEASLSDLVRRAEEIARQSAPDTEYLPPPGPAAYRDIPAYDEATAACTPAERAERVREVIGFCSRRGVTAAGSFTTSQSFTAVANSAGLFGYFRRTEAHLVTTVMTDSSSGWAQAIHWTLGRVNAAEVVEVAYHKALTGRQPRPLEPGRYTVILEPEAVAGMIEVLGYGLDAKAAHEGRSALSGKEHQRIAGANITLRSQPTHPECPAAPFLSDGWPTPEVTWIDRGTLATLAYSRFWAHKTGHPRTDHPTNLILEGGEASLEEMVASVERGLLVTRFWYIRMVDPMKLLLTGMTRDGLFWIEEGKIQHGLKNMRFNESPLRLLNQVERCGKAAQRCGEWLPCYLPPLKVRDFQFTSGTLF
jgi:predicted Zn-dependent protease